MAEHGEWAYTEDCGDGPITAVFCVAVTEGVQQTMGKHSVTQFFCLIICIPMVCAKLFQQSLT